MEDKLLKKYIELFGDEPPFPPENIMKTLVKMKEDGTFEEKLSLVEGKTKKIVNTIEKISGEKMSLKHPFFDIDQNIFHQSKHQNFLAQKALDEMQ